MSDKELLEQAFDALKSFAGDLRWAGTWHGKVISDLAQRLEQEDPFKEIAQ